MLLYRQPAFSVSPTFGFWLEKMAKNGLFFAASIGKITTTFLFPNGRKKEEEKKEEREKGK